MDRIGSITDINKTLHLIEIDGKPYRAKPGLTAQALLHFPPGRFVKADVEKGELRALVRIAQYEGEAITASWLPKKK